MIKEIVKDPLFLMQKSSEATKDDLYIAHDLLDTLRANLDNCVGMAANMIGYKKAIIVVSTGIIQFVMINPKIISKKEEYKTEEGCLSLIGVRPCTRYKEIEVTYQDESFKTITKKYSGFVAEIIQHEIDHINGIII